MSGFDLITDRARQQPARIVLPEGDDPRVIEAAIAAQVAGTAKPCLLGTTESVNHAASSAGLEIEGIKIIDPVTFPERPALVDALVERRKHKGMTAEKADIALKDFLNFACMMVSESYMDGCVAGAVYPTADVVRTAMQLVGKASDANFVSSLFCMIMKHEFQPVQDIMMFADCALVIEPDAEQLAEIAIQTGQTAQSLLGLEPAIAMLSFSTAGSANHAAVEKVQTATRLAQSRQPDWTIIGDVQLDAAVIPEILQKKAPDMAEGPLSNILIFPSLEAGNIGYKLCERFGGCDAIGPVLQGLAKPVNDLSRGCKARDIENILAITSAQAS